MGVVEQGMALSGGDIWAGLGRGVGVGQGWLSRSWFEQGLFEQGWLRAGFGQSRGHGLIR